MTTTTNNHKPSLSPPTPGKEALVVTADHLDAQDEVIEVGASNAHRRAPQIAGRLAATVRGPPHQPVGSSRAHTGLFRNAA